MPYGGLVQAPDGNFYGTTYWGGANESGIAFRMSPSGQFARFVDFGCEGEKPSTTMVLGKDGYLYGTSTGLMPWVGDFLLHNCPATIWKLAPNGSSFQVLVVVGGTEAASLMQASGGNFYGTTRIGGLLGFGTIFQMTPSGAISTLYEFSGSDGSYPVGPMIQAADGNLYGTTYYGGTNDCGTIFRLTFTPGPNVLLDGLVSGVPAGYTLTNGVLLSALTFNGLTNYWVLPVNFINSGTGQWSWTAPINTLPSYQGVTLTFGIAAEYRTPAGYGICVMLAQSSLLAGGHPIGVSFSQTFPGLTEAAFLAALRAVHVPVPPVIAPPPLATFILEYPDQMALVAPGLDYSGGDFFAYSGGQRIGTVSARIVSQPPLSVRRSAGNIILSWRTAPGQTYQVQCRTNLNQGNWVNLGAPISTTNTTTAFTIALSTSGQQFYRVLMP